MHCLDLVTGQNAALSSTFQRAMPPEDGGKCGTNVYQWELSNLTLGFQVPLPIPLAEYSVKLKKNQRQKRFVN